MTVGEILAEANTKVALKIDKQLSPKLLEKIKRTGLKGEELYNLKKTIVVHKESGLDEKRLLKLIDDYMGLVREVHKYGKELA